MYGCGLYGGQYVNHHFLAFIPMASDQKLCLLLRFLVQGRLNGKDESTREYVSVFWDIFFQYKLESFSREEAFNFFANCLIHFRTLLKVIPRIKCFRTEYEIILWSHESVGCALKVVEERMRQIGRRNVGFHLR